MILCNEKQSFIRKQNLNNLEHLAKSKCQPVTWEVSRTGFTKLLWKTAIFANKLKLTFQGKEREKELSLSSPSLRYVLSSLNFSGLLTSHLCVKPLLYTPSQDQMIPPAMMSSLLSKRRFYTQSQKEGQSPSATMGRHSTASKMPIKSTELGSC